MGMRHFVVSNALAENFNFWIEVGFRQDSSGLGRCSPMDKLIVL